MSLRDRFLQLFNQLDRKGKEELLSHLEENQYFTCPSSSQFHGAKEEGNLEHSLNVTEVMLKLAPHIAPELPQESIIISGLFHDLGKASYFGKPNYIPNFLKSGELSKSKPYETNKDRLPIPHQIVSVHILSKYINLTEEETYAILYHNGLYTSDGYVIKGNETPLLMLLHFSDMWASRVIERAVE
ncbi:23S rRNA maturation-related 3'-5' exoribonuclease YhaM [Anaerosolibacter carboniphilus]|uniref:23S rRNA maturation-related 3'-5' exoribonuclease YhaM n=1 Tax=Anaerosolibacter carboniphilus TaxID=1417629 RepID=A0A841KV51_9FIRM|nr:HD domain-containing protein [Anaerosolibacter carboniphilus]MBB6217536.1 23S rRNA maturation-related 3'-5' exoribonuclease YhaM [Anaerosolibacter carboniphilus]